MLEPSRPTLSEMTTPYSNHYIDGPVKCCRSSSELLKLRQSLVEQMVSPAKQEQVWQSILKDVPWPGGNTQNAHSKNIWPCHSFHSKISLETREVFNIMVITCATNVKLEHVHQTLFGDDSIIVCSEQWPQLAAAGSAASVWWLLSGFPTLLGRVAGAVCSLKGRPADSVQGWK